MAQFGQPPKGYIAGVGRGAVGFVTRSDLGSGGANSEMATAAATGRGVVLGAGRGVAAATGIQALKKLAASGTAPGASAAGGAAPNTNFSEANFDKFAGYSERLFGDTPYDDDDREADRVYNEVDERMEQRTAKARAAREAEEAKKSKLTQSRIADGFADLKPQLAGLSTEDWEAIPEIGDRSLRYKKKADHLQNAMPVPDNIIEMGRGGGSGGMMSSLPMGGGGGGAGAATPADASGVSTTTDIVGLQKGRTQMLSMRLDRMGDSVSGQTTVDPKGYLTSLTASSAGLTDASDLEDVKKARLLMKSVVTTNPRHGPGWIALARLEEQVRNLSEARRVIRQGCELCPTDEDVWLEAARLQTPANARIVLADAVKHLPTSVKIWQAAADLETSPEGRKAVLRKALTLIPASEKLWKAAVSLEGPEDAKVMLARAVECVPGSVDMWLALARLETYENAQKVLNQARAALPGEPTIWVTAAQLEEAQGHEEMVDKIVQRALKSLSAQQVVLDREAWIKHAEDCERAGSALTCAAIMRASSTVGVEEVDRLRTWLADAEALEARGSIVAARTLYAVALQAAPDRRAVWMRAIALEKKHGKPESLTALYRRAVSHCPQAEVLWLMAAKDSWLAGKVDEARGILREAFAANPASEAVLLAAVKLEWENDELQRARALLERARTAAPSERVWMKSALLERESGDAGSEERLLLEGVAKFPSAPKLWMMLGQMYDRTGRTDKAAGAYQSGLKHCPSSITLWKLAAGLEERLHGFVRARTLLEAARQKLPKCPELWLESVRLERRAGHDKLAESLMAKALQECPASGILWAEDILTAPRPAQKRKSVDALKRCDNDAMVVNAVAQLFWDDHKLDKARKWFDRAVTLNKDYGDAWAAYFAFETQHGTPESRAYVEQGCTAADPAHGEGWQAVSKKDANRRLSKVEVMKLCAAELMAKRRGLAGGAGAGAAINGASSSSGEQDGRAADGPEAKRQRTA